MESFIRKQWTIVRIAKSARARLTIYHRWSTCRPIPVCTDKDKKYNGLPLTPLKARPIPQRGEGVITASRGSPAEAVISCESNSWSRPTTYMYNVHVHVGLIGRIRDVDRLKQEPWKCWRTKMISAFSKIFPKCKGGKCPHLHHPPDANVQASDQAINNNCQIEKQTNKQSWFNYYPETTSNVLWLDRPTLRKYM